MPLWRSPVAVIILFTTGSVWIFFVSRAINVFGEHLRHERDILFEAKLLLDSVCDLPRSSFPYTGELVRCDAAREAVRRGNAHLTALELTSTRLLSELARTARRELVDVTWALGFMGVVSTLGIAFVWLAVLRIIRYMRLRNAEAEMNAYSPLVMERRRRLGAIPEAKPAVLLCSDSEGSSSDTDTDTMNDPSRNGMDRNQIRMLHREYHHKHE